MGFCRRSTARTQPRARRLLQVHRIELVDGSVVAQLVLLLLAFFGGHLLDLVTVTVVTVVSVVIGLFRHARGGWLREEEEPVTSWSMQDTGEQLVVYCLRVRMLRVPSETAAAADDDEDGNDHDNALAARVFVTGARRRYVVRM